MPELELWKIFAGLGVPGIALGVLYMLFRRFNWRLPQVPRAWVGPLLLVFMLIVGGIIIFALHQWSPPLPYVNKTNGRGEGMVRTAEELRREFRAVTGGRKPPLSVDDFIIYYNN